MECFPQSLEFCLQRQTWQADRPHRFEQLNNWEIPYCAVEGVCHLDNVAGITFEMAPDKGGGPAAGFQQCMRELMA